MSDLIKMVLFRLGRGFIAGFLGVVGTYLSATAFNPASWGEIITWLNVLAIAGVAGGISGLVMAGDKWIREIMKANNESLSE